LSSTLETRPYEPIDIQRGLKKGLEHPIGVPSPLWRNYRNKKICVVIDDMTRPTPVRQIFPTLLEALLGAGAACSDITVLVANGTHAPLTDEAIFRRLGLENRPKVVNAVNHDPQNAAELENLGYLDFDGEKMPLSVNRRITEADAVFSVGTIEPHIMAGFGGGYKNIVPGCAGLDTISATHLLGPASRRFGNVGRFPANCPVRIRIDAAARRAVPDCFIVNTVLDFAGSAVGLFCGDPGEAHLEGCRLAREVWGAPLKDRAQILLGSGYPMTHDLCQASKAFSTGIDALREGGLVLLALRCRNGLGDYCVSPTRRSYEETREIIRRYGTERYVELKLEELKQSQPSFREMPFYENFLTQSNAEALRKADVFIYTPDIPFEIVSGFGLFKAFQTLESMLEEARSILPEAEVILSPSGGTCFPYSL
jgi:nickel-dependent lactate racemase